MNRRKRAPKGQVNRGKGYRNIREESSYRLQVAPGKQVSQPDSIIVDLPWTEINTLVVPGAVNFYFVKYRINSCWDPDFSVGGTSAYNFSNYATLYRRYRVISAKVDVTITNHEAFPIMIQGAPSDFDLGGFITSRTRVFDLGEMPYAIPTRTLSAASGMDRVRYTSIVHFPSFIGNKQSYMADVAYSALNNTNPALTFFWNMGMTADNNMSNGVTVYLKITYRTLWSERNFDINSAVFREEHIEARRAQLAEIGGRDPERSDKQEGDGEQVRSESAKVDVTSSNLPSPMVNIPRGARSALRNPPKPVIMSGERSAQPNEEKCELRVTSQQEIEIEIADLTRKINFLRGLQDPEI
jgi:hypothetical protein